MRLVKMITRRFFYAHQTKKPVGGDTTNRLIKLFLFHCES